jgi:hypothetical protein
MARLGRFRGLAMQMYANAPHAITHQQKSLPEVLVTNGERGFKSILVSIGASSLLYIRRR